MIYLIGWIVIGLICFRYRLYQIKEDLIVYGFWHDLITRCSNGPEWKDDPFNHRRIEWFHVVAVLFGSMSLTPIMYGCILIVEFVKFCCKGILKDINR